MRPITAQSEAKRFQKVKAERKEERKSINKNTAKITERKMPSNQLPFKYYKTQLVRRILHKSDPFSFDKIYKLSNLLNQSVDILSDEEENNFAQSTPIKFQPINVLQALNFSGGSLRAVPGSEESLEMTASTFHSEASPKKIEISLQPRKPKEMKRKAS